MKSSHPLKVGKVYLRGYKDYPSDSSILMPVTVKKVSKDSCGAYHYTCEHNQDGKTYLIFTSHRELYQETGVIRYEYEEVT